MLYWSESERLSSRRMYKDTASSICERRICSSAVCDREESPGPSLTEGKGMRAWSESVGEPNVGMPSWEARRRRG